jgi:hypothetical protein
VVAELKGSAPPAPKPDIDIVLSELHPLSILKTYSIRSVLMMHLSCGNCKISAPERKEEGYGLL